MEKVIEELFKKHKKIDLKIIKKYLKKINFVKNFKIINIVGTNGKGSIASYISEGLIFSKQKTGTFTSPHIFDVCERIKINNIPISMHSFKKYLKRIDDFSGGFFETCYVIAMIYFCENECNYAVLEAGIGGKLDCTNAVDGDYGVLTSIGLDHTEILGETKEEIALDKISIANKGMEFFINSLLENNIFKLIKNSLENKQITTNTIILEHSTYKKENEKYANKILNKILKNKNELSFSPLLGRTTVVPFHGFKIIIDVAHNKDGIKRSIELLNENNIDFDTVVISLSKEKDDDEINGLFINKDVYLYENRSERHKKLKNYKVKGTPLNKISDLLEKPINNILFIGSFYLAEEVLEFLKIEK